MNTKIILATINARYIHTAFGLRYLYANLKELIPQAIIKEFNLGEQNQNIIEELLQYDSVIVNFSIYIWNVAQTTEIIKTIKLLRPEITIAVGGPEASYEYETAEWFPFVDYLLRGEGEIEFYNLCSDITANRQRSEKVINCEAIEDLSTIEMPYRYYFDSDIANRVIYVESSRGCPFSCEFCISSLDKKVRKFPLEPFLAEMKVLIDRGVHHFKFVDRTFNLEMDRVSRTLNFFLENWKDGMQLHFEIVPDKMRPELLEQMSLFPDEGLHLEVGVQSYNPSTQKLISRKQDFKKSEKSIHYLMNRTGALVHTDLVIGLPDETLDSFADGFNQLIKLRPQEIQIGFLKRLKGTPINRHTENFKIIYSPYPPFEVLQTKDISYKEMLLLKKFSRYFDLYYNSGNFPETTELLWAMPPNEFEAFMQLSEFLWNNTRQTFKFSLKKLTQYIYQFLISSEAYTEDKIIDSIKNDFYRIPGRKEKLESVLGISKASARW